MFRASKFMVGGLAGAALLASAGAALAYPGTATGSVNVRSGPGTSYPIVSSLVSGEGVNIADCAGAWCQVTAPVRGWVAAGFLGGARRVRAQYYTYPDYYDYPFYSYIPDYSYVDNGGSNFPIGGMHHHRHFPGGGDNGGHHRGGGGGGGQPWGGGSGGGQPWGGGGGGGQHMGGGGGGGGQHWGGGGGGGSGGQHWGGGGGGGGGGQHMGGGGGGGGGHGGREIR